MATLSTRAKIGFWLAVVLALADLVGLAAGPAPAPGEQGPPMEVLVFSAVMGVVTLVAAGFVWRSGTRAGLRIMAGSRILSGLTALPAFFVPDVPAAFRVFGAATVLVTIVAVVLLMHRDRTRVGAARP